MPFGINGQETEKSTGSLPTGSGSYPAPPGPHSEVEGRNKAWVWGFVHIGAEAGGPRVQGLTLCWGIKTDEWEFEAWEEKKPSGPNGQLQKSTEIPKTKEPQCRGGGWLLSTACGHHILWCGCLGISQHKVGLSMTKNPQLSGFTLHTLTGVFPDGLLATWDAKSWCGRRAGCAGGCGGWGRDKEKEGIAGHRASIPGTCPKGSLPSRDGFAPALWMWHKGASWCLRGVGLLVIME